MRETNKTIETFASKATQRHCQSVNNVTAFMLSIYRN